MLNLSRFRAIIFDFDGVIADSETLQLQAWHQVAREQKILDFQCTLENIAGRQDLHIAPELFPPPHDSDLAMRRKWSIEDAMEESGQMLPLPGSSELIRRASITHKLAIASSRWQEKIERWLKRQEMYSRFRAIVGKQENLPCKPSPAPYVRALELLDIQASQSCAIEDSSIGIEAAKAANLFTIQLCHPHMRRCVDADLCIESLQQLL